MDPKHSVIKELPCISHFENKFYEYFPIWKQILEYFQVDFVYVFQGSRFPVLQATESLNILVYFSGEKKFCLWSCCTCNGIDSK